MKRRALAFLLLASAACSSKGAPTKTAETAACDTTLRATEPVFEKPAPPAARPSRIVVELRAPVDRLERLLARSVPQTLAQSDHQPIGSAGVAKYRVQRGALSVALEGDRLLVRTPIRIHIEVSKGLGPFTINYGRCDPELMSTVSVPLRLTADFHVDSPTVTTQLTRGCTIAVVDVSSEIQAEARRQSASLERDLRAQISRIPELARAAFAPVTLPLQKSGCGRFRAQRFEYELPRIERGILLTRVGLVGDLEIAPECAVLAVSPSQAAAAQEPVAAVVERLEPESVLGWRRGWSYADLARTLALRLPAKDGTRVREVEARPARVGDSARVALRLALEGRVCGPLWVTAMPVVQARANTVGFGDALLSSASEGAPTALVAALASGLQAELPSSVHHDLDGLSADLDGLVTTALALARGQTTIKTEIADAGASISEVVAGPDELSVFGAARLLAVAELQ